MGDYGLKVMKAGYGVTDSDIRNVLFSSKYTMLKYHSDSTASVSFSPGDQHKYVEVSHSLGYVPAFIAYYKIGGKEYLIPSIPSGVDYISYGYAWADTNKIRCGYDLGYGWNTIELDAWTEASGGEVFDELYIGNYEGAGLNSAVRYEQVPESGLLGSPVTLDHGDTVYEASLDFYMQDKGSNTQDMKIKTYGIDVDNCTSLSGSETSAVTTQNVAAGTLGERFQINVKDQVQEIINRAGWQSGNGMGFYIRDNGSPTNAWRADTYPLPDTRLVIKKTGSLTVSFRIIVFKDKIA